MPEYINTIIVSLIGLLLVMRDIFYSKKRIEAKDDAIKAKEAEISTLKSSNAELREFAKTYGPSEVKEIIELKMDKAQEEAKKVVRESIAEYTEEIKRLKIENARLGGSSENGEVPLIGDPDISKPSKEEQTKLWHLIHGPEPSIIHLFGTIKDYDAVIWLLLRTKLEARPETFQSHIFNITIERIRPFLEKGAELGFYDFVIYDKSSSTESCTIKLSNIKEDFWTTLAYFMILEEEIQNRKD